MNSLTIIIVYRRAKHYKTRVYHIIIALYYIICYCVYELCVYLKFNYRIRTNVVTSVYNFSLDLSLQSSGNRFKRTDRIRNIRNAHYRSGTRYLNDRVFVVWKYTMKCAICVIEMIDTLLEENMEMVTVSRNIWQLSRYAFPRTNASENYTSFDIIRTWGHYFRRDFILVQGHTLMVIAACLSGVHRKSSGDDRV